jgi:hypothetical protein
MFSLKLKRNLNITIELQIVVINTVAILMKLGLKRPKMLD